MGLSWSIMKMDLLFLLDWLPLASALSCWRVSRMVGSVCLWPRGSGVRRGRLGGRLRRDWLLKKLVGVLADLDVSMAMLWTAWKHSLMISSAPSSLWPYPNVLVHVAGGGEQSVTDVALVRPLPLPLCPGPAPLPPHPVHGLQVDVEVPGLGESPPTQPTLVGPLVSVRPQVSLQQWRHGELFLTGGTLEWQLDREPCWGRWRYSWRRGLPAWPSLDRAQLLLTPSSVSSNICLPFSHDVGCLGVGFKRENKSGKTKLVILWIYFNIMYSSANIKNIRTKPKNIKILKCCAHWRYNFILNAKVNSIIGSS